MVSKFSPQRAAGAAAAALLSLAAVAAPAAAQGSPVDLGADRPDFTESAVTVPRGTLQLEAGATWERSERATAALSGPEALLRWGVADRLELRLELPEWVDSGRELGGGLSDAALGLKLRLGPFAAWEVAAIAAVTVPTGDDALTSSEPDPAVAAVMSRDLGGGFDLAVQLVAAWPTESGARALETLLTVVVGAELGARTGGFLEIAVADGAGKSAETLLHAGCTYQVGHAWQLDAHFGAGLSDGAPDLLLGAGLAVRF